MRGKVVIVGAGPGDPELITVKGLRALREADVVVYDRLVPEDLLKWAKPGAELIFAGKAAGKKRFTQEEINELLVKRAKEGKLVVRLKGGDPMVLGRGGEEMLALARAGVQFEVVPGVTSAVAAPAAARIPITYRGISSSFAVATGKEDPEKPRKCVSFRKIARAVDTIVVLMGLERLEEVCRELIGGGLPPSTPVALVKDATTPRQRVVEGTIENIARKAREAALEPPVVMVVGNVVNVRREIAALESGEKLVVLFRPEETAGELEALLAEAGYPCVNIPAVRVVPTLSADDLEDVVASDFDCAVFTSQVSVRVLEELLAREGLWERFTSKLRKAKVVAIGPKTGELLEEGGVGVDVVPKKYCSSELARVLASGDLSGARVVLFRSAEADESLEEELRKAGAAVRTVRTHKLEPSGELAVVADLLRKGRVRGLVLTSSLIAKLVDEELRESGLSLSAVSEGVAVFSIGPATSRTLAELGVKKLVEAREHTSRGLYEAIVRALGDD